MTAIVAVAKFINVALQMLAAHTVELPKYTALEQRPEAFNGVYVNIPVNVPVGVFNDAVRQKLVHAKVALIFVSHKVRLTKVYVITNESTEIFCL